MESENLRPESSQKFKYNMSFTENLCVLQFPFHMRTDVNERSHPNLTVQSSKILQN